MITSKNNLSIVNLTTVDKKIPVLDCVRIESDGTTVAGNGKSFMVVSPVPEEIQKRLVFYDNKESLPATITSNTVKDIIKNIPLDRQYNGMLEHTDMISKDDGTVSFVCYDGARKRNIDGKSNPMEYAPYKKLYSRALSNKKEIQLVVNAKRFLPLIETILKVSQDTGDFSPMFIEFTDEKDIIIRMINPKTGQRCIGLMWSYKGNEAKWLEPDQWEEGLRNGTTVDTNVISDNRDSVPTNSTDRTINLFKGEYAFLSNFYRCDIDYEGIRYLSSEHAFQAAKTLDTKLKLRIACCSSPADAKKLGRGCTLRDDWNDIRINVMTEILRIKFSNSDLRDKLIKTYPYQLIEGNTWNDTFWGVCNGKGENNLGKILVSLRDEFRCIIRKGAKKVGNRQLARIIDKMCPECGKYHLASDGTVEWCSCKSGCNYFRRIVK